MVTGRAYHPVDLILIAVAVVSAGEGYVAEAMADECFVSLPVV
jgi:hypothetical protein